MVGQLLAPFLYHADWKEGTTVSSLRRSGADRVRLLPGVADRLVVLGPMLRPLIELHWTNDVARWTGVNLEDDALRAHLFGRERASFPARLVGGIRDLQDGACFYCGHPIRGRGQVDHFLAWSRWPNDAVENLVLADRCNGAKSDHLGAVAHLNRWTTRLGEHGSDLDDIATSASWRSDPARSRALVATTYSRLAAGTPLWVHGTTFEMAGGPVHASEDRGPTLSATECR